MRLLVLWLLCLTFLRNEAVPGNQVCPSFPRCRCSTDLKLVNCEDEHLTEIPRNISNKTEILILEGNPIRRLRNDSFVHLPNLVELNLASCKIDTVDISAFRSLSDSLRVLNLSGNPLPSNNKCAFLEHLPNLRVLDLSETERIGFHKVFKDLSSLTTLILRGNRLSRFPWKQEMPDNLETLDISANQISALPSSDIPRWKKQRANIKVLIAEKNKIRELANRGLWHFPFITYIDLSYNDLRDVNTSAFESNSIRTVIIRNTKFHLNDDTWTIFHKTPNITRIELGGSRVECGNSSKLAFQTTKHLKRLDLSRTGIYPTKETFQNLRNLEELDLSQNSLSIIKREVFESVATSLRSLSLSSCRISTINFDSLPLKLWKNLRRVDFSSNPYICDCSFVWLFRWLKFSRPGNVTVLDYENYHCQTSKGSKYMSDIDWDDEVRCFQDLLHQDPVFIVVLLLMMSLLIASPTGSVLYRFRWNIRYWYFVNFIKQREIATDSQSPVQAEEEQPFLYDAFIGYCRRDEEWVKGELLPRLETEFGLSACIHDRDWMLGKDIIESIFESVDTSRKTVLIVSNAFALSPWCHFELMVAQTRLLLQDRSNLVLVMLEEIADCNITPRLHLELLRGGQLEWTDNELGRELFWERMRRALTQPSASFMNATISMKL